MNHKVVDTYIKMIKKEISSIYSADEFLSSMREYLDDYCDEHPGCTTEDLEEEFGTPEEIASEFLDSKEIVETEDIKKLTTRKRLITIVVIALAVILIYLVMHYRDVSGQIQGGASDVLIVEPSEPVEDPLL